MKEIEDDTVATASRDFGNWFAGFTDGEGHFAIQNRGRDNMRANYKCRFRIQLRDDDRPILEAIHETLGIGSIYNRPVYDGNPNVHTSSVFQVDALKECVELVCLFEKYPLRAKKQQDFAIWKQAVEELQNPIYCRNPDLLEYYCLKIKEVRQYEKQDKLAQPTIKKLQLTIEF